MRIDSADEAAREEVAFVVFVVFCRLAFGSTASVVVGFASFLVAARTAGVLLLVVESSRFRLEVAADFVFAPEEEAPSDEAAEEEAGALCRFKTSAMEILWWVLRLLSPSSLTSSTSSPPLSSELAAVSKLLLLSNRWNALTGLAGGFTVFSFRLDIGIAVAA